jgi:hypothetical protein
MVRMSDFDEKRLRELDEALRFSARAAGYHFPDTTAEGLIAEEPIQAKPLTIPESAHPALIAAIDQHQAEIRDAIAESLPEDARFIVEWATWKRWGDAIEVTAGDVVVGVWTLDELMELVQRYREASGS